MNARLFILLAAVFSLPRVASAQIEQDPVEISLSPYLSDEFIQHGAVQIVARNRSPQALTGSLHIGDRHTRRYNQQRPYEIPLDLPAGESRRVFLPLENHDSLQVEYRQDDIRLGSNSEYLSNNGRSIVLIAEQASTLRPRIQGLNGVSGDRLFVGTLPFDSNTSDPISPRSAELWQQVELVVAHAPSLERLDPTQTRALRDYVESGGALLVSLRTPEDRNGPFVRSLFPQLSMGSAGVSRQSALIPGALRPMSCPDCTTETFGASRDVGFGRAFVAGYDVFVEDASHASHVRELINAIVLRPRIEGHRLPIFRLETDRLRERTAERLLDPNANFHIALVPVAFLLLFYIIAIGPLNFHWIRKKGRPLLATVTTPLIALACLGLLLVVGSFGKGIRMRYRRIAISEVREGSDAAFTSSLTAHYLTHSHRFALPISDRGRLIGSGAIGHGRTNVLQRGNARTLEGISGGLWTTIYTRSEERQDLNGGVVFQREEERIRTVQNNLDTEIRGAVLIDGGGWIYSVGDLAPGQSAPVPEGATTQLVDEWSDGGSSRLTLRTLLGITSSEEVLLQILAPEPNSLTLGVPVLIGRLPERCEEIETFSCEEDYRFIRVVPQLDTAPLEAVPEGVGATEDWR